MVRRRWIALACVAAALAGAGIAAALTLRGGGEPAAATSPAPASTRAVAGATEPPATTAKPESAAEPLPDEKEQAAAVERLLARGLPVYCGGGKGRYVALTFDDGPGPYTALALKILRLAGARATFFLVGRNLASWPELPRRETARGALGNHSWTHAVLSALPRAEMASELSRTKGEIERLARRPVRLFRPPYGRHSEAVDAEARSLGMLQVLWSVDSRDSLGADYRGIARNVKGGLRPGAIVLLHENRGQTIRALRFHILPELERRGLGAVSVPELLALDPPSLARQRGGLEGCR